MVVCVFQYDERKLTLLGDLFHFIECAAGAAIFPDGDRSDLGLWVVLRGRAEMRDDAVAAVYILFLIVHFVSHYTFYWSC
jgi:hypothetical protein